VDDESPRRARSSRRAAAAFGLVLVGAAAYFVHVGRTWWFVFDDWDFIAWRRASSPSDLMRPHNEHWSTIPILVYRGVYSLVQLHSYLPYQAVVIGLHLSVAALLRVVMRRSGVGPWTATAAASAFALFGAGNEDILWAFQIGFVGSLAFGLGQLLLATGSGTRLPPGARQGLAVACGLGAVMCSGVGVTMVFVVAVACALRRRWSHVALQAGVPGLAFAAWWLAEGRGAYESSPWRVGGVVRFVVSGLAGTFTALGQAGVVGLAIAVVLGVGAVLVVREAGSVAAAVDRLSSPIALVVGAVAFFTITAAGRAATFGADHARSPRYLHLGAAMLLPAIAVAAGSLGRRRPPLGVAAVLLLLVGIPGNLDAAGASLLPLTAERRLALAVPGDELAAVVPQDLVPGPLPTVGWLRRVAESGGMPDPPALPPAEERSVTLRLSLYRHDGEAPEAGGRVCRATTDPVEATLDVGDRVGVLGGVAATALGDDGEASLPIGFPATMAGGRVVGSHVFEVVRGPLHLRFTEALPGLPGTVCLPR
jgi:hypothetical protein